MAEFIRFTERLVSSEFRYAFALSAVDLTGSGSLDLVATDADRGLYWFENRDGVWIKHLIDDDAPEARAVCAADVDVDGLVDLVGTASKRGEVAWYRNPGTSPGAPWTKHVIDTAASVSIIPGATPRRAPSRSCGTRTTAARASARGPGTS